MSAYNSTSKNPGLTIHAPHPSAALPRAQASTSMSMTPFRDGFCDIAPSTLTPEPPVTAGLTDLSGMFLPSPRPSPIDQTPNALDLNFPSFTTHPAAYSTQPFTTTTAYDYDSPTPAMLLQQLQNSGSTTREGSPAEPRSPLLPTSIDPNALHQPVVSVVTPCEESQTSTATSSSGRSSFEDDMANSMQGGKWHPGYMMNNNVPSSASFGADIQMDIDFQAYNLPQVNNAYYAAQPNYGQTYLQPQMEYAPVYAQAYPQMLPQRQYNLFVQPQQPSTSSNVMTSPLSSHSSPLNPPSSITSSPLILTRNSFHQRGHSTSSLHTGMSNLNMNIPTQAISPSTLITTPSDSGISGIDESGSSAYSSHGHSRHASAASMTVGQWAESYKPGLGKAIDNLTPSTSSSASIAADKKRKRISKQHAPRLSISSTVSMVFEDDQSAEDEEDEYVGQEESEEGSDEEFEMRRRANKKGTQKIVKKRRMTPSDEDEQDSPQSKYSASASSAANDYGSTIKVTKLIPIDRTTKSCPHCQFVPSNGRFSDLKRHHGKHLVDDAGDKERWVCTLCGDVVEEDIVGEDGEIRRVRVWIPRKGLASTACKKYTRKDSAKRHWVKEHGDKGVVWDPTHLEMVDIVREEKD